MKISKIIGWSAGLALALTATVLAAQGFGPMLGGGHGKGQAANCGPMTQALNLTEAQQANLKTLTERHQAALDAEQKVANEARDAMRKAMHDPAVSDAKVKELHANAANAMTAVMLERRAMMREFEAYLTPDQKATLDKQRAQGGPGQGMGMGMGRGQGMGMGQGMMGMGHGGVGGCF